MGDEQTNFQINITGDASGIVDASRQSTGALNGVAGAQEEAGKQAAKHGTQIRGLHKLFHGLNEIVPGLGVLMQAAFSPIGAAISIAFMALRAFHEKMKEFDEECRKAAEEAAKPLTNRLEEQRETTVRTAEGIARLSERLADAARGQEGLKDTTEKAIASLKAQQVAAESLNDAVKENELASLEEQHAAGLISEEQYANQRLEIEQKHQEKKRELAEREEMTEILIKKRLLEQAEMKQPELTAAAGAAEKAKEKALEDLGSYDKGKISKGHDDADKALADFVEKHRQWSDWFAGFGTDKTPASVSGALSSRENLSAFQASGGFKGILGGAGISEMYAEWAKLTDNATRAKKAWDQAPGEEARLKVAADRSSHDADEAARRAEENQRYQTDTGRDIGERRLRYDARSQSNRELTDIERDTLRKKEDVAALGSPEGKMVQDVSATETALAHGQGVSAGQQSQVLALTQLLKSLGAGNDATIKGLASVHETQEQHNARLIALVEKIQQMEAKHRDTFNQ